MNHLNYHYLMIFILHFQSSITPIAEFLHDHAFNYYRFDVHVNDHSRNHHLQT